MAISCQIFLCLENWHEVVIHEASLTMWVPIFFLSAGRRRKPPVLVFLTMAIFSLSVPVQELLRWYVSMIQSKPLHIPGNNFCLSYCDLLEEATNYDDGFECFFLPVPNVFLQIYNAVNGRITFMLDIGRKGQRKWSCTSMCFHPALNSSASTQNLLVSCGAQSWL